MPPRWYACRPPPAALTASVNMDSPCYTDPSAATCADFKRADAGVQQPGGLLSSRGRAALRPQQQARHASSSSWWQPRTPTAARPCDAPWPSLRLGGRPHQAVPGHALHGRLLHVGAVQGARSEHPAAAAACSVGLPPMFPLPVRGCLHRRRCCLCLTLAATVLPHATGMRAPRCPQSGEAKGDHPYCTPASLVANICGPDQMGGVSHSPALLHALCCLRRTRLLGAWTCAAAVRCRRTWLLTDAHL